MNKQIIEEMAKVMCGGCIDNETMTCSFKPEEIPCDFAKNFAEALTNAGYRKIPENAVVLINKKLTLGEYKGEVQVMSMSRRVYDVMLAQARKETAEKFAERLKARLNIPIYYLDAKDIDEICKEITEGKK